MRRAVDTKRTLAAKRKIEELCALPSDFSPSSREVVVRDDVVQLNDGNLASSIHQLYSEICQIRRQENTLAGSKFLKLVDLLGYYDRKTCIVIIQKL